MGASENGLLPFFLWMMRATTFITTSRGGNLRAGNPRGAPKIDLDPQDGSGDATHRQRDANQVPLATGVRVCKIRYVAFMLCDIF